jgi:serine/threonine protein kinase
MIKASERRWNNWTSVGGLFKEGGQSRLYLVKDMSEVSDKIFVLKELKNPKRIRRFAREIKAITEIKPHPNVINIIDAGIYRNEAKPCYVMEKADCSLDEYLPKLIKNISEIFKLFEGICKGVAHLHENNIIHRDIKPENILIFQGIPKISDFGLCLIIDETRFTSSNEAVGSRLYMAPELEGGRNLDVDQSADVYSLGKVLYYILSEGNSFSREQYNQQNYRLSTTNNDPRFDIFSPLFKCSITTNIKERYKNAGELKERFISIVDKFSRHPRTTAFLKLGSFSTSINDKTEISVLESLDSEEINELINYYKSRKLKPSLDFFEIAIKKTPEKNIENLVILMLDNEVLLGTKNLIELAGKILLKNSKEMHFIWLREDNTERFLTFALENNNIEVVDNVAQLNIFSLQSQNIIQRLSKSYFKLSSKGKQNFLIASYKIQYEGKLELMIKLLDDNLLDDVSFEAVIAGICSINNPYGFKRIYSIEDTIGETQIGSYIRGMLMGVNNDTIIYLTNHDWKNPLIKIAINSIKNDHL